MLCTCTCISVHVHVHTCTCTFTCDMFPILSTCSQRQGDRQCISRQITSTLTLSTHTRSQKGINTCTRTCLFDLACFFYPSFSSFIKTCIYSIRTCTCIYIYTVHVHVYRQPNVLHCTHGVWYVYNTSVCCESVCE